MAVSKPTPSSVDEYLEDFPADIQQALKTVRATVGKAAPKAEEAIKYGIPTLVFQGNLLSFGAWKEHIGIYPVPSGDSAFNKAIAPYRSGKSSAQFPLNKPMPVRLISKMVKLLLERKQAKPVKKMKNTVK